MSNGVNKAIIVGNLGADPEMKDAKNGKKICTMSVATSESWTDNSGQKQEKTEWHRVVFFNKTAEICGQYLVKGSQVYIEGRIQYRQYEAEDGTTRYSTEIMGDKMQMIGAKTADQVQRQYAKQEAANPTPFDKDAIPF
jgi:single-strand DNA-binding protein